MGCPDVTVIIVSFNTEGLLRRSIQSVADMTKRATYDVVVVDNKSSDGSPDMVEREFPEAKLIRNAENRGFAAASNQGIGASDSRYVALLNSDAFLANDAISFMVDYLDGHSEVAVAGPRMTDGDGRPLATAHGFENLRRLFFRTVPVDELLPPSLKRSFVPLGGREARIYMANYEAEEPVGVDWVSGACMVVRRKAIHEVGLLDEAYFMYMEDDDWCRRMRDGGREVHYVPEARVQHLVERSFRSTWTKELTRYRSACTYYRKHEPRSLLFAWPMLALRLAVARVAGQGSSTNRAGS